MTIDETDKLAREIANDWGTSVLAGNAQYLTPEFKSLSERASDYQRARQRANEYRSIKAPKETDTRAIEVVRQEMEVEDPEGKEAEAHRALLDALATWKLSTGRS